MALPANARPGLKISPFLNTLTWALAASMFGVAGLLVFLWGDSLAAAAGLLGSAIGWAAGVLLSPYQAETSQFKTYGNTLTAFVGGFLVSKLDRVFEILTDEKHGLLIFSEVLARRTMIAVSCFFIAAVSTFVARQYQAQNGTAEHG